MYSTFSMTVGIIITGLLSERLIFKGKREFKQKIYTQTSSTSNHITLSHHRTNLPKIAFRIYNYGESTDYLFYTSKHDIVQIELLDRKISSSDCPHWTKTAGTSITIFHHSSWLS
uniref:Uncharacterized protein n=1 Tax=Glossina pallidipes TaxID=7398 RepID=A0A1A9Z831_GLOPL